METEEVVFKESFGGSASAKSAYCLIYVNEEIDEMLSKNTLAEYCNGSLLKIDNSLKKYV